MKSDDWGKCKQCSCFFHMEHEGFSDFIQMKSIMLCEGKLSIQCAGFLICCLFVAEFKGEGDATCFTIEGFFYL